MKVLALLTILVIFVVVHAEDEDLLEDFSSNGEFCVFHCYTQSKLKQGKKEFKNFLKHFKIFSKIFVLCRTHPEQTFFDGFV